MVYLERKIGQNFWTVFLVLKMLTNTFLLTGTTIGFLP